MAANPAIVEKLNALYDAKAAEIVASQAAGQALADSTTAATGAQTAASKADDLTRAHKAAEADFVSSLQADLDPAPAVGAADAAGDAGGAAS